MPGVGRLLRRGQRQARRKAGPPFVHKPRDIRPDQPWRGGRLTQWNPNIPTQGDTRWHSPHRFP